ncbi:MAG: TonB-dependent receptor [Pedobacter sp.]|nr:TonB-dependent receptor [Pedobacter sp.]MDQ8052081.1 TonB-dependent receptor [Pedobacter sp.]
MKKPALFFLFLFIGVTHLFAQVRPTALISVDFKNAAIDEIVGTIESQVPVHFYYDALAMDSLRVTLKADQKTLTFILEQAFKGSNYYFAISDGNIFLTRNVPMQTDVVDQYFKIGHGRENVSAEAVVDHSKNSATTEYKVYEIGIKTNDIKQGNATIAGYLRDFKSGEPITGASIQSIQTKTNVFSDRLGFYTITLPKGAHTLLVKTNLGETKRQVVLYSDGTFDIDFKEKVISLKMVNILSQRNSNLKSLEMGVNKLDIKAIKRVPTVFGEPDVLRVMLTLPGVQSVGEATTGFNVRGGAADQNLILLDHSTIYNPSHFFGFFSAFNPQIVSDVQLYKSSIPEKFGGRLSSVLEVRNREGNKSKFTGSAGIGLITTRFNIEGPIDSGRTSFILGGRTTYSNWMLKLLPTAYKNSKASFTDVNLGLSHKLNDKNELAFSGYFSTDAFKLSSDTTYSYGNKNASLEWRHHFNNRFTGAFIAGFDHYKYRIESKGNEVNAYDLDFAINQTNFKTDFTYALNRHALNFGLSSIYYQLQPGRILPEGSESLITPIIVAKEQAVEGALYLGDKFDINTNLSVNAGLRYSFYAFLGPNDARKYAAGLPRTDENLVATQSYANNKVIKTYGKPELRLSARYNLSDNFSIKAGYNTLQQYIHLISNTTAIAPTDMYKLSDPNIRPQSGSQISLGIYRNLKASTIETSIEVYYKRMTDYLDYKSGANLLLNQHLETDVISTKGKAYGAELFIRKNVGRLNGWISYTYSRTLLRDNDPISLEKINDGAYYPANFDKPHSFNFTGNYKFSERFGFSLNLTYSTGRPITLPIAKYYYAGSERVYYSDRNAYRIPDYFRSDIAFNIEGNHLVKQWTHGSWSVGLYNLTGRKNAFSTYFTQQKGIIEGNKLAIFATVLPFINYNIRF